MLEIKNLSIKMNDRYLVQNLSFTLNKGEKLAIIGEEGNGKSTFLKAILGICEYAKIEGTINLNGYRIGYLPQSITQEYLNKKVYDYLFSDDFDYYEKVHILYKYFSLFHLNENILEQTIRTLSGGEKVKIGILKLLINEYDILFLDEPTNDLDIEALEWLEDFINSTNKPIMYVSHDEVLLLNTANRILHFEQIRKKTTCRYTLLTMDYSTYVIERIRKLAKQTQVAKAERRDCQKQQEKLQKVLQKVEHQQNTISRSNPHGAQVLKKKMHSLKSQEKRLNSIEFTEIPDVEESISFFFEDVIVPKTKSILHLNLSELKVGEKLLSKNISLNIVGNTHLCIIGQNGCGKSTLLRIIYENLKNRSDIRVGYMPQDYDNVLKNYDNVLDFVCPFGNQEEITRTRMYLGNMNITRNEMTGKLQDMSNGTKAKLFLIKLVLEKPNVLILDEPTRNVSPLSNPVIRKVLRDYKGTIISVSHDRMYINEVVDKIYSLTLDGLVENSYK